MNLRLYQRSATGSVRETHCRRLLRQRLQRVLTRGIPLEEFDDDWCAFVVWLNTMRREVVLVSDWRDRRPVALPGLLDHPFANFLAEVVDVVLGHQDLDAVHELLG